MTPAAEARMRAALAELAEAILAAIADVPAPLRDAPDRLYSVAEAAELLGCGRTETYSRSAAASFAA